MKTTYSLLLTAIVCLLTAADTFAQSRITRSEFICYDRREDAKRDIRTAIDKHIVYAPELTFQSEEGTVRRVYEQRVEIPAAWNDYNAYLHIENTPESYTLFVNGKQISAPVERFTPSEFFISPYLEQGENTIAVVIISEPYMSQLDEALTRAEREMFANSYIFAQRRLGIYDFRVRLVPDSLDRFAQLRLDVVVDNSFSTDETIEVGYDIYAPDGKLMEYSVNGLAMSGYTRDTMSFTPWIYHSNPNRWSPTNPKLYDLMLYIKRSGILWEYIPLKVGFGEYAYTDSGAITAFDKELSLRTKQYNAATDMVTTEREIKRLKAEGYNCLCPSYPQPRWYYDICDRVGIYVIDCAAINSPSTEDNRNVGGTPANAPWLVDDYIVRVDAMYRRSQNHICIIGFRLGGDNSGNGYNMYKAYEHLKSYGDSRPIIYGGADGEWNSDIDIDIAK